MGGVVAFGEAMTASASPSGDPRTDARVTNGEGERERAHERYSTSNGGLPSSAFQGCGGGGGGVRGRAASSSLATASSSMNLALWKSICYYVPTKDRFWKTAVRSEEISFPSRPRMIGRSLSAYSTTGNMDSRNMCLLITRKIKKTIQEIHIYIFASREIPRIGGSLPGRLLESADGLPGDSHLLRNSSPGDSHLLRNSSPGDSHFLPGDSHFFPGRFLPGRFLERPGRFLPGRFSPSPGRFLPGRFLPPR